MLVALAVAGLVVVPAGVALRVRDPARPTPTVADRSTMAAALVGELDAALAGGDRAALVALADPDLPAARRELAAIAANVRALRVSPLRLRYLQGSAVRLTPAERRDLGADAWVADVRLSWRLAGVDRAQSVLDLPLVLGWEQDRAVFRSARVADGPRTPLWLLDRVAVRRTGDTLVVLAGTPATGALSRQSSRAVATVRATLPRWRAPLVVEAPATAEQFRAASGLSVEAARPLAAVTTTADGSAGPRSPARVYLNPPVFRSLGRVARQVVLAHEATHVALGSATDGVPTWLSEGIADYVALVDSGLPVARSTTQLRRLLREEGPPDRLPWQAEADGADPGTGASYEAAWVAVRLIATENGEPALVRFYRVAARDHDTDRAFREVLGTTEQAFVARWREELVALAR